MTVVEAPATAGAEAPGHDVGEPPATSGLAGLLGTVDHVGLGRLWVAASLLFLLVAGAAGVLLGVERLDTGGVTVLDDAFPQIFNLHGTAAIFLFLLPAFVGIATAVVPLQLGATPVAFPRAAAAAFWGWLLSGIVLIASYAIDGGLAGTDRDGVLLAVVALGGVVVSRLLGTVCDLTTIW
jgi:cytochrome c oxidase subunit 1